MNVEKHNQLQGQALAVLVVDLVRAWSDPDVECTLWALARLVAERYQLDDAKRNKLYRRIDTQVRQLESAGLIATEKKWNAIHQVFVKHIKAC